MGFYCLDWEFVLEADGRQHGDGKDAEINEISENIEGVWSHILKTLNEPDRSPTPRAQARHYSNSGPTPAALPLEGGGDEPLDTTRKRLIFRSWHRGTREMDLIMGRFAERYVPAMTAAQLAAYERLLTCQDPDVYDWYIEKTPVPPEEDSDVVRMFLGFRMVQMS